MKIINTLNDKIKSNLHFIGCFRNIEEITDIDKIDVGAACILREKKIIKFCKIICSKICIYDGTEWCVYNTKNKIFEIDNFDTIKKCQHPSGTGLMVILHNTNLEVGGDPYFLIFSTETNDPYSTNNSRRCRIYMNKPNYLIGYNENCKLTKVEKELFVNIMNDGGWNKALQYENDWKLFLHKIKNEAKIPNYNLLETED